MKRRTVTPVGDQEVRYGYTLTAVHHLTKLAVNTAKGWFAMDYTDLMEAAWFGIVEHLHTAEHWPPRHDLVRAGQLAVNALVRDELHTHGYYRRDGHAGAGSMPAFSKFWANPAVQAPEARVVERLTVAQIWPMLTGRQREAVTALAVHGDYLAAAEALGVKPQTFRSLLGRARKDFFALWHEGETPSKVWGTDRRVYRRETTDPAELERRARDAERARARRRSAA